MHDLKFVVRDYFCESREEFECLWIEIDALSQPHFFHVQLCIDTQRHLLKTLLNISTLAELDKIRNDNKLCVTLGDFNISLLNFEAQLVATGNFINSTSSYCYSLQISSNNQNKSSFSYTRR
jgi:hypothetical protein